MAKRPHVRPSKGWAMHGKYITGCEQVLLIPRVDPEKTNERPEGEWFDAERIELVTGRAGGYDTLHLSTDLVQRGDHANDEKEQVGGPRTDRAAPKQ